MPEKLKEGTATTTSHVTWTTILTATVPDTISKLLFWLKEQNVNALMYRVQGSYEETFATAYAKTLSDKEGMNLFVLAKNAMDLQSLADPYLYVRVQARSLAQGAHGTVICKIFCSSGAGGGSLDQAVGQHQIKTIMVNNPGLAYVNAANALCLAAPSEEGHSLEVLGVYLSTATAGTFYLVAKNLGKVALETTDNNFDLIGAMGSDITNTCEVIWAVFLPNTAKGTTGGKYDMILDPGVELYLIAPDVDYHIHVNYQEHTARSE